MPYSVPTPPPSSLSATPAGSPPAHMRSLSTHAVPSYSFTSERGPGAFASLGSLPRRGPAPSLAGNPRATSATAKRFHIKSSSDDSASSSSDDDDDDLPVRRTNLRKIVHDDDASLPALKLRIDRLGTPTFDGVPFPRSSPLSSPLPGVSSPLPSPARTPSGLLSPLSGINSPTAEMTSLPTLTELPITASNPIYSPYKYSPQDGTISLPLRPSPTRSSSSPHMYLSNGRPLKSSLKSSSSSSSIHAHTSHSHHMRHMHSNHQRASSAPTPPGHGLGDGDSSPSSPASNSPSDSGTSSPTTPKSVHFPSLPTHLERVHVFHKSAKPASLLAVRAQGEDTETETETDRDRGDWGYKYRGGNTDRVSGAFPFPKISTSPLSSSNNASWPPPPVTSKDSSSMRLELDMTGYPVPNPTSIPPKPDTHILLESVSLVSPASEDKMHVQGSFIVRNVAFQKEVGVRFTMDQWNTVSEVKANWVANFSSPFPAQRSSIKEENDTWDRFSFSINLSDYPMASLPSKVIEFVGRYTVPGAEYWDNCGGRNWRVRFKVANAGVENPSLSSTSSKMPLNIVVSPPTVSAPTASMSFATAASPTSITPSPAPNTAPAAVTHPSPVRFEALAHATAQRLRRFSLSNYVAPGTSVPPVTQVKTAEELTANPEASLSSAQSQESPDGAKPSLRAPLSIVTTPSNETLSSAVSPPSNSSSPSSSSLSTPPTEGNSESLYDWFVQQWCFAGPSGMPDQNWKRNELGNNTPPSRGSLGLEIEG